MRDPDPSRHPLRSDDAPRFRLLGPLTAVRATGGRPPAPVELGPPKQRATLALLLLNAGRVVSVDRLIDALWGEAPPPRAVASLQAYVSNLRRILRDETSGAPPIARQAPGYRLDVPAGTIDVGEFAATAAQAREAAAEGRWDDALVLADAALALWHGEFLADFADELWVQPEAARLDELRSECREVHIAGLLAAGRAAEALAAAHDLRAADRLRERACWLEMLLLHRAGRSQEALDLYRAHVALLDEQLGLEPGSELRELEMAILRHDPALAGWPRPATWTGATEIATPPEPLPPPGPGNAAPDAGESLGDGARRLIGRRDEVGALEDLLREVAAGAPRWLLLTGPAGIGKTRLAEELTRRARERGGRESWARCSDEESAPAWWPIRQLLRGVGENPDAMLASAPDVDADTARFALYERVAAAVQAAAAAGGPLVLVVDDVQWADRSSGRCLAHLAGTLRAVPVVTVLTLRDGEPTDALVPLLEALARSDGHRQLAVGPLGRAEVAELAGSVVGREFGEDTVAELVARTQGNPLFVAEYARLADGARLAGDVPLAVRAVMQRRLAGLDHDVLGLLGAAAVLGDEVDLGLLAATTGQSRDDVADRLDEAADEHVLIASPHGPGYAFAHGLLREEVLARLPPSRRRRLHAAAAAALAGGADGDRVSRRAGHLVAALPASDPGEVVAACRAAALIAEDRRASEDAADWWAQALRAFDAQVGEAPDDDRDALLVAHVAALTRAGRGQTVIDVADAALQDAARAGRVTTVGRLCSSLLRSHGAWPWPWPILRDPSSVVERLGALEPFVADDADAHARLLAALGVGFAYHPDPRPADELTARAIARAENAAESGARLDALLGRLILRSGVAPYARESVELGERVLGLAGVSRQDTALARSVLCLALLGVGRARDADAEARAAITDSDAERLTVVRVQLRFLEASLAMWRGDVAETEHHLEIADRVNRQTELFYAGTVAIARACLARSTGALATIENPGALIQGDAWAAAVAAARGEAAEAERRARSWLEERGPWIWSSLAGLTLVSQAVADAALRDLAEPLLAELAPFAGAVVAFGHAGTVGSVDLVRGRLSALVGEHGRARELLQAALSQADAEGGAPTAADCRAALGALDASS